MRLGYGHVQSTGARFYGEGTFAIPRVATTIVEYNPPIDEVAKNLLDPAKIVQTAVQKLLEGSWTSSLPTVAEIRAALEPAFECLRRELELIVDETWAEGLADIRDQKIENLQALLQNIVDDVFPTESEIRQAYDDVIRQLENALNSLCQQIQQALPGILAAIAALIPAIEQAILALVPSATEAWNAIWGPISELIPEPSEIANAISAPLIAAAPTASQMIEAIMPIINNLAASLTGIADQIFSAVASGLPQAESLAQQITNAIISAFPTAAQIQQAATQAIQNIIQGPINSLVSAIGNLITGNLSSIFPSIPDLIPGLISVAGGAISSFCAAVASASNSIIAAISAAESIALNAINQIQNVLCNNVPPSIPVDAFFDLVSSIGSAISSISAAITPPAVTSIPGPLLTIGQTIVSQIAAMFAGVQSGIAAAFATLSNLAGSITTAVFNAVKPLYNIGEQAIINLINVIRQNLNILNQIYQFIKNILGQALDALRGQLGAIVGAVAALFQPLINAVSTAISSLSALLAPLLTPETLLGTIAQAIINAFIPNWGQLTSAILQALGPIDTLFQILRDIWNNLRQTLINLVQSLLNALAALFNFDNLLNLIQNAINTIFGQDWLQALTPLTRIPACLCDALPDAIQRLLFDNGRPLSKSFLEQQIKAVLDPVIQQAQRTLVDHLKQYWDSRCMYPPTKFGDVFMHTDILGLTWKVHNKHAYRNPGTGGSSLWSPPNRFLCTLKVDHQGPCDYPKSLPFWYMCPGPCPDPIKLAAEFIHQFTKMIFESLKKFLCGLFDGTLLRVAEELFRVVYRDIRVLINEAIRLCGDILERGCELAADLVEGLTDVVIPMITQGLRAAWDALPRIAQIITTCAFEAFWQLVKSGVPQMILAAVKGLWQAVTRALPNFVAAAALAPLKAVSRFFVNVTQGILQAMTQVLYTVIPSIAMAASEAAVVVVTKIIPDAIASVADGLLKVLREIDINTWASFPLAIYRTVKEFVPNAIAGAVGAAFTGLSEMGKATAQGVGMLLQRAFQALGGALTGGLRIGSFTGLQGLSDGLSLMLQTVVNCLVSLFPVLARVGIAAAKVGLTGISKLLPLVTALITALQWHLCPPAPTPKTVSYCENGQTKQIEILAKTIS